MHNYKPGDVIDDKFRIVRTIGRGGMGVVHEVTYLEHKKNFALKTLIPEAASNAAVASRFLRESRAAAKLRSRHICHIADTGKFTDGNKYLLMELLDGKSVAQLLKEDGPFEPARAAEILVEACDAIAEAHSLGIIHRDLKPEHLFIAKQSDGTYMVKVVDFGISKMERGSFETAASDVIGTPSYMSPEQLTSSRDVDARSDVWSLGVCLFELLTGELPWQAANSLVLATKIMTEPPRSAHSLRPELKPGLVEVIERALRRDQAKRFQSAKEFAEALAPFAPRRKNRNASGHPRTWMVGAGIALALVGLALVYSARKQPPRSPSASPPAVTTARPQD